LKQLKETTSRVPCAVAVGKYQMKQLKETTSMIVSIMAKMSTNYLKQLKETTRPSEFQLHQLLP